MTKRQTSTPQAGKADISIEKFVQAYLANGQNGQAAYIAAHPNAKPASAAVMASRWLKKVKVQARIADLQGRCTQRTKITLESLINDAYGVFKDAREGAQFAAAIAAIKEVGILSGLRVERQERENKNVTYAIADEPLTDDEWKRQFVTEH